MKILIADDHEIFRNGFTLFLERIDKHLKIFQVASYSGAINILQQEKEIEVFVLDLDMPDMQWEKAIKVIQPYIYPGIKLIVLSALDNVNAIKKSFEIGAKGFIPKRASPEIIESAINLVINGGVYIPETMKKYIFSEDLKGCHKQLGRHLTERQKEVISFVYKGMSNKQIAHELGVTEATIKLHINSILKSLGAQNRTDAVMKAQEKGLL